jgi:hypothetical protein
MQVSSKPFAERGGRERETKRKRKTGRRGCPRSAKKEREENGILEGDSGAPVRAISALTSFSPSDGVWQKERGSRGPPRFISFARWHAAPLRERVGTQRSHRKEQKLTSSEVLPPPLLAVQQLRAAHPEEVRAESLEGSRYRCL